MYDVDGKSVYPDVDYYLAVKELMENLHITWLPCEATQKPVYKAVRRALLKVADIVVEKEISYAMLVNQLICQFNEHVTFEDNAHDIHMQNGFQSSTVKLFLVK